MIPLCKPDVGEREVELVTQVLRSGRLSMGPCLDEFEQRFAARVGCRYAVATSSGTAALHLCTVALGIGDGDEVLTTPFSFVASANCLLYEHAVPSFVDVHPATLNIDPSRILEAIEIDYVERGTRKELVNRDTGRVLKGILPVHVFGLPCDMEAIRAIAERWGLLVIEDACEALGAAINGRPVGTLGNAGAFAFYPNKQMTTGEGGMVVTNDAKIAAICRSLRNQGRDESADWLRHERLGFNYRLSELHCALGLAQLERLGELLAARSRVASLYTEGLSGTLNIALPSAFYGMKRSWFAYVIQLTGPSGPYLRRSLIDGLRARGIACQAYFPPIPQQPYFARTQLSDDRPIPIALSAGERCLALPFFASMTEVEVREVCTAVREIIDAASAESPLVRPAMRRAARGAA